MKVEKISIKNFRLLKDVELSLDDKTTVIVGRNNSGKTSLTELIKRLLSGKKFSFRLEDFSLSCCEKFWEAFAKKVNGSEDEEVRKHLPCIQVNLYLSYEAAAIDLGALSNFIIDLNPECTTAILELTYELSEGKIDEFFEDLEYKNESKNEFFQSLKERVPRLFKINLSAVDPNDPTNRKQVEMSKLNAVLQSGFINAQRGLDDETYQDKDVLGKILEALFETANSSSANDQDKETAEELETAVRVVQNEIDKGFNEKLRALIPAMSVFGYPGLRDPGLLTETTLDVQRLLVNNTKVRYSGISGISLPEAFNGLGARNLVFILLKLLEFFKAYKASEGMPGAHLIFIEEPEAHLHPQMQEVFIRQLNSIVKIFEELYNEGKPWPVQFIVSTHSSHIANEASFDAIRYFLCFPSNDEPTTFSTKIKDLKQGLGGTSRDDKNFLHQYMTLTRCDLLFADKAILIEGTSERILMPRFVEKFDSLQPEGYRLATQYISTIEVGGAYAHIFYPLLDFLELKTLIITDLDTVNADPGEACRVSVGVNTSNACIRQWFGVDEIIPDDLINKTDAEKTKDIRRLAYELPEVTGGVCGRSFEDAFMLANPVLFALDTTTAEATEEDAWRKAKAKQKKKSQFALDYAINQPEAWITPRYITEGLLWLAGAPMEEPIAEEPDVIVEA
jgi:predicted ATP-dependent endonuclease of OLD family